MFTHDVTFNIKDLDDKIMNSFYKMAEGHITIKEYNRTLFDGKILDIIIDNDMGTISVNPNMDFVKLCSERPDLIDVVFSGKSK